MNRVLILTALFFLAMMMISCGGDDTGNTGNTGDTGDTVDIGNNDDTDDTGNTGDTGLTDDTSDIEETDDTGDTGYTGECTGSDKFCLSHDGLNWSDIISTGDGSWYGAVAACEKLGGRLPTISELRTLIQNCPATETGGECGVTDDCLSYDDCLNDACSGCELVSFGEYSVFGDGNWFWSSSEVSEDYAWAVYFSEGRVGYNDSKNYPMGTRCVR